MSERPKRKLVVKPDIPAKLPRKWKIEEMEKFFHCIMEYGHKDLNKLQEQLPGRSIENIKTFMRTLLDTAAKMNSQKDPLDLWINHCAAIGITPWNDCKQISQILKYLSVDGLIENHPLPERCQGIDFCQAYRLLYQAMMGYPIQPVNQATADFVVESLVELNGEIKKQTDAIKQVSSFLEHQSKADKQEGSEAVVNNENLHEKKNKPNEVKKPLKVYQRKKPTPSNTGTIPSAKITIEENPASGSRSSSSCSKDFSVIVEDSTSILFGSVNVPVPYKVDVDEDEEELLKSPSYNPFHIPKKWLEEPLYLNLVQKL